MMMSIVGAELGVLQLEFASELARSLDPGVERTRGA